MVTRIYTKTLALLYAKQGHYDDAEECFRALLDAEPDNSTFQKELDKVLKLKSETGGTDLIALFTEWVTLIKKVKSVQQ